MTTVLITLTDGREALIDASDRRRVSCRLWSAIKPTGNHSAYAEATIRGKRVYMHRFILRAKRGQIIDHVDGNGLNNTRANLRFCTKSQDQYNRPGWIKRNTYKGVFRVKKQGYIAYECRISISGEQYYLGMFRKPRLAARVYDYYARKYQGEFARTNFKSQTWKWKLYGRDHEIAYGKKFPDRLLRLAQTSIDERLGLPNDPKLVPATV